MLSKFIYFFILTILYIQIIYIFYYFYNFINKHFICKELNLQKIYGKNSWVLITGCSSGQGKLIAIEFAKRNFNIILSGRKGILETEKEIKNINNNVKTHCIIVDFCDAYKEDFFNPFIEFLDTIPNQLSILVNNVANRVAWEPYHEMPEHLINNTIVCGTIVQSRLTQIAIKHFMKRKLMYDMSNIPNANNANNANNTNNNTQNCKSAIINITAQCMYNNFWFGKSSEITVPYLSVYEASNAFGYYHSQSIQKEYEHKKYSGYIDILNITPGAVITENTKFLETTPFAIDSETFVKNIFKLLGNYKGSNCAYWGHDISNILTNFMFFYKDIILENVGKVITEKFMDNYNYDYNYDYKYDYKYAYN